MVCLRHDKKNARDDADEWWCSMTYRRNDIIIQSSLIAYQFGEPISEKKRNTSGADETNRKKL